MKALQRIGQFLVLVGIVTALSTVAIPVVVTPDFTAIDLAFRTLAAGIACASLGLVLWRLSF